MALSKKQSKKLGSLLSIMCKEEIPDFMLTNLINEGYVELHGNANYKLTLKGIDERRRLSTLAGLNITYTSEKNIDQQIKENL